jgi:hypothetical protein
VLESVGQLDIVLHGGGTVVAGEYGVVLVDGRRVHVAKVVMFGTHIPPDVLSVFPIIYTFPSI